MTAHIEYLDFRLRPPIPEWVESGAFQTAMYYPRSVSGFDGARSAWEERVDLLVEEMDACGVRVGVAMGRAAAGDLGSVDNEAVVRFCEGSSARFVMFVGIDLSRIGPSLQQAESLVGSDSVRGVSIEPGSALQPMTADDARIDPIYAFCQDHKLPISISLSSTLSFLGGHELTWANPVPVQRVAMRHPTLPIVISHAAWPFIAEAIAVSLVCPNVYLSPDMYWATEHMPFAGELVKAANLALSDRMFFGSAYPSRPVHAAVKVFAQNSFSPTVLRKVASDNARRLLDL